MSRVVELCKSNKMHYFIGKGVLLSNGAKKYFPLFFSAYYIARENINIFTGYVVGRENINIFTGSVIEYNLAKRRKRYLSGPSGNRTRIAWARGRDVTTEL